MQLAHEKWAGETETAERGLFAGLNLGGSLHARIMMSSSGQSSGCGLLRQVEHASGECPNTVRPRDRLPRLLDSTMDYTDLPVRLPALSAQAGTRRQVARMVCYLIRVHPCNQWFSLFRKK